MKRRGNNKDACIYMMARAYEACEEGNKTGARGWVAQAEGEGCFTKVTNFSGLGAHCRDASGNFVPSPECRGHRSGAPKAKKACRNGRYKSGAKKGRCKPARKRR